MSANLFQRFESGIRNAEAIAVEAAGGAYSFGDIVRLSGRYAAALIEAGVVPGDRVALQVEKSVEALLVYLATVRAGAVFVPLNPAYTAAEIGYFLGDAAPSVFICDPERFEALAPQAKAAGAACLTLAADGTRTLSEAAASQAGDFATVRCDEDDLAAILYTSGTTGRSKGAMLTHRNLVSNALTLVDAWRFGPDDRLIHALPIFHTHGLFVASNVCLFCGARMIFQTAFSPDAIFEAMPRATCLMGVPTFYTRLLQHPRLNRETTRSMRLFVSGSAPLLAETHRAWEAATGHVILERYGMTETNMNTSNPYEGKRIAGSVGKPLPGVSVRVMDGDSEAGAGAIGMIQIKGPNVFKGYWRAPEKTATEFTEDGFFISGDLGTFDADGYLSIVGRAKDLIISGGYNIYPKEIESELDALEGILESAVIGIAHPDLGEGVVAVLVASPGATLSAEDIRAALSDRLARYKTPRHIVFVDTLPRNAMGKVQKNVLRDDLQGVFA